MQYYSALAKEKLFNNTICIRKDNFIRNMGEHSDVNGNTVFVSNILPYNMNPEDYVINKGDLVRYMPVSIVPKIPY
jgi:hypothetical protein